MVRAAIVAVMVLVVSGAPTPAAAQVTIGSCSTTSKNIRVRDILSDIYLWYTELPNVDPARYATPEDYLEAVRYRPLDAHFSYITSREANQAFYSDSQYVGFGFSMTTLGQDVRVTQVFPESPASEAGMARGDRITSIDGTPTSQLIATGGVGAAFGPAEIGVQVRIEFSDRAGGRHAATLVKRLVTIPTVTLTRVYEVQGRRIGYFFFRNFVEPSHAALDAAFAELNARRLDELVVDLRYNGGGRVAVAQHLASLIGGVRTNGQVLAEYFHNDRNVHRNQALRFDSRAHAATLNRLIVITTPASASASELIINGLRPYMPVVIIGDRTYGKPVGQYQFDFCDKTFAPVSFTLRNARGEADFFDGFPPDCAAADDIEHDLGDVSEASLREALTYAATDACSPAGPRVQRLDPGRRAARARGWQSLVNAY